MGRFELSAEADDELDGILEVTGGLGFEVEAQNGPEKDAGIEWGDLHEAILDALLDGDEDWNSDSMRILGKSLKVSSEELQAVYAAADSEKASIRRLEKMLERQKMSRLGYNWSNLEASVLEKLGNLVAKNGVRTVSDLLAIAKTANSAIRRGSTAGVPQMTERNPNGGGVSIHLNQQNNGLPGAGSLGTISLTLNNRILSQLRGDKIIDGESERLEDKIEMLGPEDIVELSKKVDEKS